MKAERPPENKQNAREGETKQQRTAAAAGCAIVVVFTNAQTNKQTEKVISCMQQQHEGKHFKMQPVVASAAAAAEAGF